MARRAFLFRPRPSRFDELGTLIGWLATENPTWGYTRIQGALGPIAGARATDAAGRVRRRPRLGGLLNFYERAA